MAVLLNYLTQADFGVGVGAIFEPVALETVLSSLRIESDSGDSAFIESVIIPSARQLAERKSGSAIRPARYKQTLSAFPRHERDRVSGASSFAPFSRASKSLPIKFAHGLVNSVESVTYIDAHGVTQSLDVTKLSIVAHDSANMELSLSSGACWPQAADVANAVTIIYRAGMLPIDFSSFFPSVIQWILLACGWAYENREMFLIGKTSAIEMPASYVDALLEPITVSPRF
jgi:hypothetical protein